MKKPIFFAVLIVFIVLVGGFFYWWQNQADVRELNKTLPDGVRVVKSLVGNEYKVVNKIDGYEFKIPPEWRGLSEIEYAPERTELGYTGASIALDGQKIGSNILAIDRFKLGNTNNVNIESWAKNNFSTFGLVGNFTKDNISNFEVVKTQENIHLSGMFVYFFNRDSAIYSITNGSEEFIRYIIANGRW